MKRQNGITLIALVITIIVLLILAGVSISMVVGNNGILNQANTAKIKTAEAEEAQQKALDDLKIEMDKWISAESKPENNKPEGNIPVTNLPADFFDFDEENGIILGINQNYIGQPVDGNNPASLEVFYYNDSYCGTYLEGNGWCILKEPIDTLVIPANINGKPVETIRNIGALNVRKVVVEEGIKNIEKAYAILDSTDIRGYLTLEEFVIPSTVEKIGEYAFMGCTSLNSIDIPSSVTNVEYGAFYNWLSSQIINCEVSSEPETWDYRWCKHGPGSSSDFTGTINWGVNM